MIVISNASPIINLASIGQLELLNKLYGKLLIPRAVNNEITVKAVRKAGPTEIKKLKWIGVKAVSNKNLVHALKTELDAGEAEAIALAV